METLFQNKYRIASTRVTWHNYDAGIYFVTFCTANKVHYFGEVTCDPEHPLCSRMRLTEIGRFVDANLSDITTHYPYAEIPAFVVMPNHVHAVVVIHPIDEETPMHTPPVGTVQQPHTAPVETLHATSKQRGDIAHGKTLHATFLQQQGIAHGETLHATSLQDMGGIAPKRGMLSTVIRGIKSATTRYARQHGIVFAWQSRFNEHIVRNQDELNRIAQYIEGNIANWDTDELNLSE